MTESPLSVHPLTMSNHDNNKKKVTFHTRIKVRKVSTCKDYSNDEMRDTWYSRNEYEEMREEAKTVSDRLSNMLQDDDMLRSRGLESSKIRKERRKTIREGQLTVLLEQEHQWNHGRRGGGCTTTTTTNYAAASIVEPQILAKKAIKHNQKSVRAAIRRGHIIQQEVQREMQRQQHEEKQLNCYSQLSNTTITTTTTSITSTGSNNIINTKNLATKVLLESHSCTRPGCQRSSSDTIKLAGESHVVRKCPSASSLRNSPLPRSTNSMAVPSYRQWRQLGAISTKV